MPSPKDTRIKPVVTDFGTILRNMRLNLGMTIASLAEKIHKSKTYITQVERGVNPAPKRQTLKAWLTALGVPDKYEELHELALLNRTFIRTKIVPQDPSNEDIVRLIDRYEAKELTDYDRQILTLVARRN